MKRFLAMLFVLSLVILSLNSCKDEVKVDLDQIPVETEIQRFDRAFYRVDTDAVYTALPKLQEEYTPFFSAETEPIFWRNQRLDPLQNELFAKTEQVFGDMEKESAQLNAILKRFYYYFGLTDTLELYTYISRLDFNYPVVYAKPYLFVALDLYLGEAGADYYNVLPQYLQYHRQAGFLNRDVAFALAEAQLRSPKEPMSLLDAMIYKGKLLKLTELLLEDVEESTLLRYPPKKHAFSVDHEKDMWVYFIEQELLFDTSDELKRRFIEVAPFSKFRTQIDAETPGQIAWWFGYRIVDAWLEEYPKMSLEEWLLEEDSRKILKLSQYKP